MGVQVFDRHAAADSYSGSACRAGPGDGCTEPPQAVEDHCARTRRSKVAAAMRPGVVGVLDVGENADEVPFAADQEPVQAFGAGARHLRVVSIKCRGVRVVVI